MKPTPGTDHSRFVRRCWRWQSTKHLSKDSPQGRESRPPTRYSNRVQITPSQGQIEGQPQSDCVCNRVMCDTEKVMIEKQCDEDDYWEFGNFPEVNSCKDTATRCLAKPPPE